MAMEMHKFFVIKEGKILDGGFIRKGYAVDERGAYTTFSEAMKTIQRHQSVIDAKNAEQYTHRIKEVVAERVKELLCEASD